MAKINVSIIVELIWLKEQTDLSKCIHCGETIYGKTFRLFVFPKAGKLSLVGSKTNIILCESCHNLVDKKQIHHD